MVLKRGMRLLHVVKSVSGFKVCFGLEAFFQHARINSLLFERSSELLDYDIAEASYPLIHCNLDVVIFQDCDPRRFFELRSLIGFHVFGLAFFDDGRFSTPLRESLLTARRSAAKPAPYKPLSP